MLKSTRSQMEIMGLVVVVILISLAVLFALQFALSKGGTSPKVAFTQEQIAENMMTSLLLTTTECRGLDMTELIQDCAGRQIVNCGTEDNPKNTCTFIEETTDFILEKTLQVWQKNYLFTITRADQTFVPNNLPDHTPCPGSKDVSTRPIPSKDASRTNIIARLEVCQ